MFTDTPTAPPRTPPIGRRPLPPNTTMAPSLFNPQPQSQPSPSPYAHPHHPISRHTESDFEAIDRTYNEIQTRIRRGSLPAGSGRHFLAMSLPNQDDNTAYVRWWAKRVGKKVQDTRPMTRQVLVDLETPREERVKRERKERKVKERVKEREWKMVDVDLGKGMSVGVGVGVGVGVEGDGAQGWELLENREEEMEGEAQGDCWVGVEDELGGPYVLLTKR